MKPTDTHAQKPERLDRRRFLKSMFGLGGALEVAHEAQPVIAKTGGLFFWADLRNGNVGFPSGLHVPQSRPGSIMKLITAACILEEGHFNPNETEECTGTVHIGAEAYHCQHVHGIVNLEEAIAKSCNCFFAKATRHTGPATIIEYARKFGLDKPVAGFKCGSFPDKPSRPTATYALGLSEDLVPNALQLLRLAAVFGTQGNVPPLRNAGMPSEDQVDHPLPFEVKLRDTTFRRIRKGMTMACQDGTANELDPEHKLNIAAKTGTVPHGKKFESWVIGFFPQENPRHAFCLYAPSGTSHESAVPQARQRLMTVDWP